MNSNRKIVTLPALLDIGRQARADGKKIVQCHGCFDIVHPGHIRYLQHARRQGDLLVVSITGDASIDKGEQRPYIPEELRAENLAALELVDYVYIDPTPTAADILRQLKPDVYVKGAEYERSNDPRFIEERRIVEEGGGSVIFSSGDVVFSSTRLIEAMPREDEMESQRLAIFCRRHGVTHDLLDQALERFRGLRVLVVGDVVIDRYIFCDTLDVASESPMMSLTELGTRTYVGGAAIVARHVAALGGRAFLLGATGTEETNDDVERTLAAEGVESYLAPARKYPVRKTRYLVEETKLLKVERAEHEPLNSVAEQQCALMLMRQAELADAVIFCDFGYGMITGGLMARVLPDLRCNVRVLSADVSGTRGSLLNFHGVDLLCPTERELRANLHDFDQGLSSVAWRLLQATDARHLIVTLGRRGLVAFQRPAQNPSEPSWGDRLLSEHVPTFADRNVDRLGCGDALLAASTLSLAAGFDIMQSSYIGSAAAALELAAMGNVPIQADDLRRWSRSRSELYRPQAANQPVVTNMPRRAASLQPTAL